GTGNFTVKVVAVDGAGNVSPQPGSQAVGIQATAREIDPADNTKTALVIGGTGSSDVITITPADAAGLSVMVSIVTNGVTQSSGPFTPTGHILVYGQAGADTIQERTAIIGGVPTAIAVPAVLFAGSGNTTLSAAG